jgi:hypothetical protein
MRRPSELSKSELFEKYYCFYKPDEEPTAGQLILELHEQWKSGPGKVSCQLPSSVTQWQCHCGRSCASASKLREHLFSKHNINNYNFHCENCNANFQTKENHKKHIEAFHVKPVYPLQKIQDDNPPGLTNYNCISCNSTLKKKERLIVHYIAFHTGRRDVKPQVENYSCTFENCNRICPDEKTLRLHMTMQHGKSATNANISKTVTDSHIHRCQICKNVYISRSVLKEHIFNNHGSMKY